MHSTCDGRPCWDPVRSIKGHLFADHVRWKREVRLRPVASAQRLLTLDSRSQGHASVNWQLLTSPSVLACPDGPDHLRKSFPAAGPVPQRDPTTVGFWTQRRLGPISLARLPPSSHVRYPRLILPCIAGRTHRTARSTAPGVTLTDAVTSSSTNAVQKLASRGVMSRGSEETRLLEDPMNPDAADRPTPDPGPWS